MTFELVASRVFYQLWVPVQRRGFKTWANLHVPAFHMGEFKPKMLKRPPRKS